MGAEELFLDITGLKLEGKSEAELMAQVRRQEGAVSCICHIDIFLSLNSGPRF